jgi:hypothetical protein
VVEVVVDLEDEDVALTLFLPRRWLLSLPKYLSVRPRLFKNSSKSGLSPVEEVDVNRFGSENGSKVSKSGILEIFVNFNGEVRGEEVLLLLRLALRFALILRILGLISLKGKGIFL